MTETADVLAGVRERVDPTPAERERLADAASRLVERAEAALAERPVEADVIRVGSTARGTWVRGDRDIDVFVRFPPDLDRRKLEEYGLDVGNEVLPDGHEEYAEHPYVKGTFEGYDVDLVPCYAVESAADIRSAVDRTPFHTAYLESRLTDELAADVRLCKQFLKGVGAYGSDLKTEGFSGYLTELLVCEYGGFEAFLAAAAEWHPPVELDPEGHGTASFDDPLVVIDPTDPERNVAAVVSARNVARVQHYARRFRDDPDDSLFFPEPRDPADAEAVRAYLDDRGTRALAVRFDDADLLGLVEDQRYPQLRRSLDGLVRGLEERGFEVVRSATWAGDETAVLFCELAVAELPDVERHGGPPVHVGEHAAGFYEKYADDPDVYGPYVDEDGRYVVERERDVTSARAFAEAELETVALGHHVATLVSAGDYAVLADDGVSVLAGEFGAELAAYVDPRP